MSKEKTADVEVAEAVQEKPTIKKPESKSVKKLRVVLTCPKYTIVVDDAGNNIQIDGNFNVKIGDYLEI